MGKVLNMLSSNGASPEQMVRRICRERGIDVDEFLSNLKNISNF